MGCCIVVAMLVSQGILLWEKARANAWLNLLALSCAALSIGLLAWHWHHIEELILDPLTFTFMADMLNRAESFCRSVLPG
ncbi:hypothetical protein [Stutzerimonas stutzeri]|uniref:hypothetical protein n=1 Tax=Stutzerimonas stutzeri TaxID=316 RepID=UPI00244C3E13|nr:hypothetical protein [Stutzerimonas stutzeri]MDH0425427.1 hypothetical protein [Stutzerimonas stutzeri]